MPVARDKNMAFLLCGSALQTKEEIGLVNETGCGMRVTVGLEDLSLRENWFQSWNKK